MFTFVQKDYVENQLKNVNDNIYMNFKILLINKIKHLVFIPQLLKQLQ